MAATLTDLLQEELLDEAFRDEWERTLLARAVANQVVKYRAEHNVSQRALADTLGVSQAVVARLELGEHEPKMSTLSRLARELGLRFTIEIHPEADAVADARPSVTRFASRGVEMIVAAT